MSVSSVLTVFLFAFSSPLVGNGELILFSPDHLQVDTFHHPLFPQLNVILIKDCMGGACLIQEDFGEI